MGMVCRQQNIPMSASLCRLALNEKPHTGNALVSASQLTFSSREHSRERRYSSCNQGWPFC